MSFPILTIIYIVAAVTFIVGLKMMSHPASARRGNLTAGAGMVLAIFATVFLYGDEGGNGLGNYAWIFGGLIAGTAVGWMVAQKVKMTAMPEMVSLFNGMGGASALLISVSEFYQIIHNSTTAADEGFYLTAQSVDHVHIAIISAGIVLGGITFSGSLIAWGKLNGTIKDFSFPGQTYINLFLLFGILLYSAYLIFQMPTENGLGAGFWQTHVYLLYGLIPLSLLYGVFFVMPIGGADMPVVISLLNSLSGISAACSGFLFNNLFILTGGILVGAAGTILTILMCKAMNRSLKNVLIGSFGGTKAGAEKKEQGSHKEITLNDAATVMSYANKVVIVPGYGLAVAQAQHACRELEKMLASKGVDVTYAIHPVAGRMPGHMNVLLAEADVSYDKLLEMEQANDEFPKTDVVLILGANDVVNPAAKNDASSPIYGMPILDVELAKSVIVNKRSMKPGYAGIENDLFFQPKTSMLFGDAKKVLQDLVSEIKTL
ncbi:MAG TPA: NAD(P)(+) transhydrogenase (Re/Si-specific) subunit beta [Chitinophagaceae bacterium]|nr:NAD(P)(+) transhydrogenase (Re/Si-specific) subunit beta [Chitinophagaceae bacterium]